ncbi:hypothetical protein D477_018359 [Arthrobacter crystallopoietes BAB-32]|uniref:DUF305 domain-containing protein n=1 Tax=Arthrobacter crystallopoietes BAB-32 TaxID=1246476 RepID=N1V3H4_9MICC|nr:DUF305 domain-containing protein [Arthrobacter crystallopoietes]EMY32773.1 hypothetical protein D477_018359 [Arthrobacter crystallopoietes BAB-32]
MKRYSAVSAAVLATALLLTGCGQDTADDNAAGTAQPTAGSTSQGTDLGMHGSSSAAPAEEHNSADAMFAQMMIPHHEQAVEMSDMMLAKDGLDPQISQLAEDIKSAQAPEIEKMTGWLKAWGEPMEMSGGHGMPGMMSEEDLAKLEAAQGDEASRLFLTQMIEHHEGAVEMAEEEAANGSDPEAVALAESVVETQTAEIKKMQELLADL